MAKKKNEHSVYERVATEMEHKHPDVVVHFDFGTGLRLPIGVAMKQKRINKKRGYPDFFLAKASSNYHGLFLEIKKEGEFVHYQKGEMKGSLKEDEHIVEQEAMLRKLRSEGYMAEFAVGFDESMELIEMYLSGVV